MSRGLKIANVCVQGGFILFLGIGLINNMFELPDNLPFWNTDNALMVISFEFLLGLYQFINALIITIIQLTGKKLNVWYKIYWVFNLIYVIFGAVLLYFYESNRFSHSTMDDKYTPWLLSGWILIFYYFAISIVLMKKKE